MYSTKCKSYIHHNHANQLTHLNPNPFVNIQHPHVIKGRPHRRRTIGSIPTSHQQHWVFLPSKGTSYTTTSRGPSCKWPGTYCVQFTPMLREVKTQWRWCTALDAQLEQLVQSELIIMVYYSVSSLHRGFLVHYHKLLIPQPLEQTLLPVHPPRLLHFHPFKWPVTNVLWKWAFGLASSLSVFVNT